MFYSIVALLMILYVFRQQIINSKFTLFLVMKFCKLIKYLRTKKSNIEIFDGYVVITICHDNKKYSVHLPYDINLISSYDDYEVITDDRRKIDTFPGVPYFVNSNNLGCKHIVLINNLFETSENFQGNLIPIY